MSFIINHASIRYCSAVVIASKASSIWNLRSDQVTSRNLPNSKSEVISTWLNVMLSSGMLADIIIQTTGLEAPFLMASTHCFRSSSVFTPTSSEEPCAVVMWNVNLMSVRLEPIRSEMQTISLTFTSILITLFCNSQLHRQTVTNNSILFGPTELNFSHFILLQNSAIALF